MAEQNSSGDGTEDRTALAEEQKEERLQVAEQEHREEGGTDGWWPRACQDAPRPLFSRAVSPLPPPSPPERDRVSESEREREREREREKLLYRRATGMPSPLVKGRSGVRLTSLGVGGRTSSVSFQTKMRTLELDLFGGDIGIRS